MGRGSKVLKNSVLYPLALYFGQGTVLDHPTVLISNSGEPRGTSADETCSIAKVSTRDELHA